MLRGEGVLAFLRKGVGLWLLGATFVAFLQAFGGPNLLGVVLGLAFLRLAFGPLGVE